MQIDFPLVELDQYLIARVIHWQPESDAAGLEVDGALDQLQELLGDAHAMRLVVLGSCSDLSLGSIPDSAEYEPGEMSTDVLEE